MQNRRVYKTSFVLLAALLCALFSGCKVTADDVETWKGTVKGPIKLVAVMNAPKYPIELRTKAAIALVEMERTDVAGLVELQHALQKLDEATRTQLVDGMTEPLVALMKGQGQAQAAGVGATPAAGPTPVQIRAKDAAFELIASASPETRKKLIQEVINWYVEDFNGRALSGNYSAEQIVRQIGAPAAGVLVNALNAHMPQAALAKVSELIGGAGDAKARSDAATRLISIEREMESDTFLNWLKEQIRTQLAAQNKGSIDAARISSAAAVNRENYIRDGAIPAMKYLAGEASVANRLLEIASAPSKDPAINERRKKALQALEGKATANQLQPLLTLALDPNTPPDVRDYAFDRVGDIRSTEALPRLWPLVSGAKDEDQRLRWRVGEMVLAIGGTNVVSEFFAKLPTGEAVKYAPEELAGYATRMGQMSPLPNDAVRPQLQSPHWFLRVLALRYFERKGTANDVAAMQALATDPAACHGPEHSWQEGFTVGKVAESAISGLRALLQAPAQPAH